MPPPHRPKSIDQSSIVINAPIFVLGSGMNALALQEIQTALRGVLAGIQSPALYAPGAGRPALDASQGRRSAG